MPFLTKPFQPYFSKDEMLEEYDFANGIREKYAQAYKEGINIVKIDSDVMKFFPDAKSVNEALRTLINLINNGQNPLKLSS
jgi:Zn/Cd-binding protein ZinT